MILSKEDIQIALSGQDAATRMIAQQLAQAGLVALPEAMTKLQEVLTFAQKLQQGLSVGGESGGDEKPESKSKTSANGEADHHGQ